MENDKCSKQNSSALILAAGYSHRLGIPKFSLLYDENTTFLEQIANQYHVFGCNDIIAVLNPQGIELLHNEYPLLASKVSVVENYFPELGRFYSIKIGLSACNAKLPVFIHNVDNPYVDQDILNKLIMNLSNADYSYPAFMNKGGHPVIISERIVQSILSEPTDDLNLKEYLKRFKQSLVRVEDERVTYNVNTPEDYEYIKKRMPWDKKIR